MLSLSTSWNYKKGVDLKKMLSETKELGFEAIELGYHITHEDLEEIFKLLKEIPLKVSDIHNFCPVPYDEPSPRHASNYYRLSSLDEAERKKAVHWTKMSIDTAKRAKAKAVVVHAGTIAVDDDPSGDFLKMHREGKAGIKEFKDMADRLLAIRRQKGKPFMEALVRSFKELMPYAKAQGVFIGLETRYYPLEIPNFDEIEYFLNLFHQDGMRYWHDAGHAEVQERLGFRPHADFLEKYKKYLIGMHIHGMQRIDDHYSPFEGDMDFSIIKPYLTPGLLKVVEAHAVVSKEKIHEAFNTLKKL